MTSGKSAPVKPPPESKNKDLNVETPKEYENMILAQSELLILADSETNKPKIMFKKDISQKEKWDYNLIEIKK